MLYYTSVRVNKSLQQTIHIELPPGMGYRYLNMCINSLNDASISCKNFVNFGPVIQSSDIRQRLVQIAAGCREMSD